MDTHTLSVPALTAALEMLTENGADVMLAAGDEYTPTPAISHTIFTYNRERDPMHDEAGMRGTQAAQDTVWALRIEEVRPVVGILLMQRAR